MEREKEEQPKFDPTYSGMEPKDPSSLVERGLKWYQSVLQPVSDWLYNVFNPGAEIQEPEREKPKSIKEAVENYQGLPNKKGESTNR